MLRSQTHYWSVRNVVTGAIASALSVVMAASLVGCTRSANTIGVGRGAEAQQAITPQEHAFTAFESGQVRPLALSPNGALLFATNTPDNRLEIFRVLPGGLQAVSSVTVGLEPVAVAARSNTEVWVVNHLSDSVSVVSLAAGAEHPRVVRTLLLGDEPRDIVFGGANKDRAFITTAHRGQNTGRDPQITTEGVGRADVWVYDANNLGANLTGTPITVLQLFTDTPRALAVSPDGSRVYAAGFHTGSQTTTLFPQDVWAPGAPGAPPPLTNHQGVPAPQGGLIVKYDGEHWVDERGIAWDHVVKFDLPDTDVFAIDANANPPAQLASNGAFAHVGTILFNMAVNPVSGKVYVSNLESRNHVRFEGPGIFAGHRGVQGHIAESRITVIDPASASVTSRHLNKHIDYETCCAPVPNAENATSVAFPNEMAVTSDGTTLYVASLGTSELAWYSTAALENDTFTPSTAAQIALTGGGPTGLILDEANGRLYTLTRFDNSISIVDTATKTETAHVAMYNPEPPSIVNGRRFLYDASLTSSHGDSACASCHIFGDFDSLAWDLGNPDGDMLNNPGPFDNDPTPILSIGGTLEHHPMKGPMTTQSLRGMANQGPMHWRGDRTGGNDEPTAQPDSGAYNEHLAFMKFIVAFEGLVGRNAPIADEEMSAFADFILQVTYPPNPLRNLDDSDTPDQAEARAFFVNTPNSAFLSPATRCNDCHRLDETANAEFGIQRPGFFGTDDNSSMVFVPILLKNPHLRNQYQKVGMFGSPPNPLINPGNNDHLGDQIRGFGYFHDGTVDTEFRFVSIILFSEIPGVNDIGIPVNAEGDALRRKLADLMDAFPSNMKPSVGQQVTLTSANHGAASDAVGRVNFLEGRSAAGHCELVAKTRVGGARERGYVYVGGAYHPDQAAAASLTSAQLRDVASNPVAAVTYTCVPPGSGVRIGVDRDLDGVLDGDDA